MNAHKLRAPVASILGLINLFHVAAPAEQRVILNYLKTCGEQLDNTIRAINQNLEDSIVETKIGNQVIGNR
jgi:signal transduction histidine kinase